MLQKLTRVIAHYPSMLKSYSSTFDTVINGELRVAINSIMVVTGIILHWFPTAILQNGLLRVSQVSDCFYKPVPFLFTLLKKKKKSHPVTTCLHHLQPLVPLVHLQNTCLAFVRVYSSIYWKIEEWSYDSYFTAHFVSQS